MAYDLTLKAAAMDTCGVEDMAIEFPDTGIQRYSAEIYDIMCQSVAGEPLQVVRSVDDMDGIAGVAQAGQTMQPQVLGQGGAAGGPSRSWTGGGSWRIPSSATSGRPVFPTW